MLPIRNEETGTTEVVAKWAVRVPEATYEAVRQTSSMMESFRTTSWQENLAACSSLPTPWRFQAGQ